MTSEAHEYFANVRAQVLATKRKEEEVRRLSEEVSSPKSSVSGRARGRGSGKGNAADRLIDAEIELDRMRKDTDTELERATQVLYGRSGRGGVAAAKGSAAADSICGYYLYDMTWRQVSDELVRPESRDGEHWCRTTARRAMAYIDRVGMARLRDT